MNVLKVLSSNMLAGYSVENAWQDADDIFIKKALLSQAEPLSGNSRVKKELAKSRF